MFVETAQYGILLVINFVGIYYVGAFLKQNMRTALIIFFLCNKFYSWGQDDSTVITKYSDNFIEVKTLRNILTGDTSIPEGPVIKNGIVITKDKNENILLISYWKDSLLIQNDEYENNILRYQLIIVPEDNVEIEKHYFQNGKLERIKVFDNGKVTEIEYSEIGQILRYKTEE